MESYFFINRNGEFRIVEADPLLPETWPYKREEIREVHLDCTKLFLYCPASHSNLHESEKLKKLLDCIAVRYNEKLDVDFALSEMGMGKSRFHAFFRSQTGMSFVAYINKVRMEQAARMLIETDHTVDTVAYDCGFDSPSHFYKCFKERYGVSPGKLKIVSSASKEIDVQSLSQI